MVVIKNIEIKVKDTKLISKIQLFFYVPAMNKWHLRWKKKNAVMTGKNPDAPWPIRVVGRLS